MKLGTLELHKKVRNRIREWRRNKEWQWERAYRFVEVKAWGEERKNVKKKTMYLGLFTGSKKKGSVYIKKKNDMSTRFLQQILSGRLLLVVIIGIKK